MFHDIPESMQARMRYLEAIDTADREDGTPQARRLRQVAPGTGRFLALLAMTAPQDRMIEVGTSAGYSAMWLSLACRAKGTTLTTFEISPVKAGMARETFRLCDLHETVGLVQGDARMYLDKYREVAFCFVDAEKDVYADCYELIIPNLVGGGLLVADNAISHNSILQGMLDRALADERVDALIAPIGEGLLLCRRI